MNCSATVDPLGCGLTVRDTFYAAKMARELLWEREQDLKLSDYLDVAQTSVARYETRSH